MAKPTSLYRTVPVDIPANAPYRTPVVAQEEAWAIKSLFAGTASPAEQGVAVRFILGRLAAIDGFNHYPTDRDTTFANGKRFVGHHIVRVARMTPEQIARLPNLMVSPMGIEDDEMPRT